MIHYGTQTAYMKMKTYHRHSNARSLP